MECWVPPAVRAKRNFIAGTDIVLARFDDHLMCHLGLGWGSCRGSCFAMTQG
ncbi:hypothetical protein BD779DRAFT_1519517 [Infundibulicybe gibba]|nr:hypothetical protein BD779DRAFT_1519517 [Infundibulicybe gibba]